jgi:hypothetical protein
VILRYNSTIIKKGLIFMRNARLLKFLAVLSVLLALYGCKTSPIPQAQVSEIQALLAARAEGVNHAGQQEYLSTVLPGDSVLMKEESNLIRSASGLGIEDYKAVSGKPARAGSGFMAEVTQSYTLGGEEHRCTYDALFVSENGKLYYDGPVFLLKQNSGVKVFYAEGWDDAAQKTLEAETSVLAAMQERLDFVPQGFIYVKLYADQQVFLQSVKLDLPAWVGGWQEYGEAIKSFAGAYPAESGELMSMLAHETTHRMVSELSNDNASYWIQEGLAEVIRSTLLSAGQPALMQEEADQAFTPYARQKGIDLEKIGMEDPYAVTLYYATSKAYAAFLMDRYGWGKVRQALEYMKKFPLIPVTGAEKIADTNERTDEAIRNVFGFSTDVEFQQAFDEWVKGLISESQP